MCYCGGSRTELSTPVSLGWHWITCLYQVRVHNHYQVFRTQSNNSVATSVDVERVFSKGRLLLSHVRNGLSVQSTRALLCLGAWSRLGLVEDEDVALVAKLADVDGNEADLDNDWDDIVVCS
jgi:hypothetical protein